jgi:multicomponent Na+:H+ antiporter subunit B
VNSPILAAATRLILPLLLVFAVFLLLRGHNAPGGGFAAGLVASAAFALHALANGRASARRLLGTEPGTLIAAGLLTALGSGLIPLAAGLPFMTGVWLPAPLPVLGKLGTPVLFDAGVFLVVLGVVLLVFDTLSEDRP